MKFKSRTDVLITAIMSILIVGLLLPLWVFTFPDLLSGDTDAIIAFIITTLTCAFIIWVFFDTYYTIKNDMLSYRSGPIRGSIEISAIRQITCGVTLWVGLKVAAVRKGLLIKYNKYDEIYISPESNDGFIKELLKINPEIEVIQST